MIYNILIALIIFAVCLPFAVISVIVPFLLLGGLAWFFCTNNRFKFEEASWKIIFTVTSLLLIPSSCAVSFSESGGFTPGPFFPQNYKEGFSGYIKSDSVSYRSGYLISYADTSNAKVILAYKVRDNTEWAALMTDLNMFMDLTGISEMEVSYGFIRDRVDFFARGWGEPGWVYIWKYGSVQRYYIKSF